MKLLIKKLFLVYIFFLIILNTRIFSLESRKKILVLLTYNISLPWAQEFLSGLNEAQKKYNNRIQFFIENMEVGVIRD